MANFTDPHRQGWPVIRRSSKHRVAAFTDPAQELPADLRRPPEDQAWQESSFDLQKGLEVREDPPDALLLEPRR